MYIVTIRKGGILETAGVNGRPFSASPSVDGLGGPGAFKPLLGRIFSEMRSQGKKEHFIAIKAIPDEKALPKREYVQTGIALAPANSYERVSGYEQRGLHRAERAFIRERLACYVRVSAIITEGGDERVEIVIRLRGPPPPEANDGTYRARMSATRFDPYELLELSKEYGVHLTELSFQYALEDLQKAKATASPLEA